MQFASAITETTLALEITTRTKGIEMDIEALANALALHKEDEKRLDKRGKNLSPHYKVPPRKAETYIREKKCPVCKKKNQKFYVKKGGACVSCLSKKSKKHYKENKERYQNYSREYNRANKAKLDVYKKEYYEHNKAHHIALCKKNTLDRLRKDKKFKRISGIRAQVRNAIQAIKHGRDNRWVKSIGCDLDTLASWLNESGRMVDPNFNIQSYDSNEFNVCRIKTFKDFRKGKHTFKEICEYTNLEIRKA